MAITLLKIENESYVPKYEQVIHGIIQAVHAKKLRRGDKLPSLNQVSKNFDVSINTVVKAYEELKRQGIIESRNGKGFHVATESIEHVIRVFLLFDELNYFKQDLFNSFKDSLGEKAKVDIFFHHYNLSIYENLILDNLGKYGKYVIMPHPDPAAGKVLERLNPEQVLVIDQLHHINTKYSYIVQDFEKETYECLRAGCDRIKKYKGMTFVIPSKKAHWELSPFVSQIGAGLKQFCQDNSIAYKTLDSTDIAKKFEIGSVYFLIPDDDLITLIKTARASQAKIGTDIGIVSFNDDQLKEIIEGGITTISTDFCKMGELAAKSILEGKILKQINPASMVMRNSL